MKKNHSLFAKAALAAGLSVYMFSPSTAKSADLDDQGRVRVPQADGTVKIMDRQTYEAYFGPVTKAREEIMIAQATPSPKAMYADNNAPVVDGIGRSDRVTDITMPPPPSSTPTTTYAPQTTYELPATIRQVTPRVQRPVRPQPQIMYGENAGGTEFYMVDTIQFSKEHYDRLVSTGEIDVSPIVYTYDDNFIQQVDRTKKSVSRHGKLMTRISKNEFVFKDDLDFATQTLQEKYNINADSARNMAIQNGLNLKDTRIRDLQTVVDNDNIAAANRQALAAQQAAQSFRTQQQGAQSGGYAIPSQPSFKGGYRSIVGGGWGNVGKTGLK